jgi:triosephosphate isomerase (TIM)
MALMHSIVHGAAHCRPYASRSAVVPRVGQIKHSARSVSAQVEGDRGFRRRARGGFTPRPRRGGWAAVSAGKGSPCRARARARRPRSRSGRSGRCPCGSGLGQGARPRRVGGRRWPWRACTQRTGRQPCPAHAHHALPNAPRFAPNAARSQASKAKFFVGGNWKCNGTHASVEKLTAELNAGSVPSDIDVVVAPPFIFLDWVRANIKSSYAVAAQNCWTKPDGAFTGEISAEMLKDAGVPWVITGHSERRLLLGESNRTVGLKTGHALEVGLSVIACIGETLDQRNTGHLYDTLDNQLQALFENVQDWSRVVLAYEPVWAIGTGVVASPEQAQEVHAYVRKVLTDRLGKSTAESVRIIYGGSVNDANCADLATREDIDGFLVGGASLKGPAFITICNARRGAALAK